VNVVVTIGLQVPDESWTADLLREAVRLRQPADVSAGDLVDIIEHPSTLEVDVTEVEITD
jgi:hypothetical protein